MSISLTPAISYISASVTMSPIFSLDVLCRVVIAFLMSPSDVYSNAAMAWEKTRINAMNSQRGGEGGREGGRQRETERAIA